MRFRLQVPGSGNEATATFDLELAGQLVTTLGSRILLLAVMCLWAKKTGRSLHDRRYDIDEASCLFRRIHGKFHGFGRCSAFVRSLDFFLVFLDLDFQFVHCLIDTAPKVA